MSRLESFPLNSHSTITTVSHDDGESSEASSADSEGEEDNDFEEDKKAVKTVTGE